MALQSLELFFTHPLLSVLSMYHQTFRNNKWSILSIIEEKNVMISRHFQEFNTSIWLWFGVSRLLLVSSWLQSWVPCPTDVDPIWDVVDLSSSFCQLVLSWVRLVLATEWSLFGNASALLGCKTQFSISCFGTGVGGVDFPLDLFWFSFYERDSETREYKVLPFQHVLLLPIQRTSSIKELGEHCPTI